MTSPRRRLETPRRTRPRILAGAAVGVALALVAVVLTFVLRDSGDTADPSSSPGSHASSSAPGSPGTTTDDPTGGPGSRGGPGSEDPEDDDGFTTSTDLEGLVLRGSDLPPGWRTLDTAGPAAQKLIGTCLRAATTPTVPHAASTLSFRSGSNGPILSSTVRDFATDSQAGRAMNAVRKGVRGCVNGSGKPVLRPLTLSSTADAITAVSFTLTQDGNSARGEVVIARVGTRSVTQVLIGLVQGDLDVARESLRTVVDRLR